MYHSIKACIPQDLLKQLLKVVMDSHLVRDFLSHF